MRTWGAILGGTLAIVFLSLVTFDRVDATGLAFCAGGRSLGFSGQHVRLALSEAVTRRAVDHRANALPTGPSFPGLSLGAGTVSGRAARMANSRSSCVLMSGRGAAFESNFDGSAQIIPRMKRPEEIAELLRVCRYVHVAKNTWVQCLPHAFSICTSLSLSLSLSVPLSLQVSLPPCPPSLSLSVAVSISASVSPSSH
jgi:hypothetical protein